MPAPSLAEVQSGIYKTYKWVVNSRKPAPQNDGVNRGYICMSMHRAPPITAKIPPGYTIAGFNPCHYVRHLGNETVVNGQTVPSIRLENIYVENLASQMKLIVGPWPDGQPDLIFYVVRIYNQTRGETEVRINYAGKPGQDTRQYPVQLYWGNTLIMADHRITARVIYWGRWGAAVGQRSHRYMSGNEDLLGLYLTEGEPWHPQLNAWCSQNCPDIHANHYACMFGKGLELRTDRIYDPDSNVWGYCRVMHQGCPNGWPADMNRGQSSAGWGFHYRSKTCLWTPAFTWVLAQDPLGLMSQAVHALIKTGNPWHQFYNKWPGGTPGAPAQSTPVGVANWVLANYYRPGVGVHMFNIPVIGADQKASSVRTDQFSILATLLGYRYGVTGWVAVADELACIMRDSIVGGAGQPAYGAYINVVNNQIGMAVRPDYDGAQLAIWDQLGDGHLGLVSHTWLRIFFELYFGLPFDDVDLPLSIIESTVMCCQALRTYAYHKWRWTFGWKSSIPASYP